jgi:D-arabinitol dehydrogenase (NADP+)
MKAAYFWDKGKATVETIPIPKIKDDEVLIQVKAAGICGTDLHIYAGEYFSDFPLIPGHEFSGVISEVGQDVKDLREGDRVTADPNMFCESCYFCKRNLQNHCEHLRVLGVSGAGTPGAFAEYVAVPGKNVFLIDERITFEQGALIEPLACIAHGMDMAGIRFGSEVLIVGAGPIGQMLLQSLKAGGGARVTLTDVSREKLDIARAYGADSVVAADQTQSRTLKALAPRGFDYVIDATGIPAVVEESIAYLKKAGTYLVFGVCPRDSRIALNPYEIFLNDWKIVGSFAIRKNFAQAINMLSSGIIRADHLVSLRGPIDSFPRLLSDKVKRPDLMKVQIQLA